MFTYFKYLNVKKCFDENFYRHEHKKHTEEFCTMSVNRLYKSLFKPNLSQTNY